MTNRCLKCGSEMNPSSSGAYCLACSSEFIPYVEPATCPDCGHPVSMHDVVDGCMQKLPFAKDSYSYCSCDKFPADQPEIASTHEERVDLSNQAFDKFIQPMPMMPLLTDKELHYICFNITGPLPILARMTPAEHSIALSDLCYAVAKQQRDADMAWHNEQIKPMVEALKIARGHLDCGWIELAKKAIDAVLKGEGNG